MTFRIPSNPIWYLLLALIIIPYVAGDAWVVKFVCIVGIYVTMAAFFLVPAVSKRYFVTRMYSRTAAQRLGYVRRFGEEKVINGFRALLFLFGVFFLYGLLPFAKDAYSVMSGRAPVTLIGQVTEIRSTALGSIIGRTIVLDNEVTSYRSLYFAPRAIEIGKRYEFVAMPHTKTLLEAKIVHGVP